MPKIVKLLDAEAVAQPEECHVGRAPDTIPMEDEGREVVLAAVKARKALREKLTASRKDMTSLEYE